MLLQHLVVGISELVPLVRSLGQPLVVGACSGVLRIEPESGFERAAGSIQIATPTLPELCGLAQNGDFFARIGQREAVFIERYLAAPVVERLVDGPQDVDHALPLVLGLAQCLELADRLRMRRKLGDDLLELIDRAVGLAELDVQARQSEAMNRTPSRCTRGLGAT